MDEKRANDEDLELLMEVNACVDGELPPARREALDARIAGDSRCEDAAHFCRWLDEAAKMEPVPEVSSEEWAALWERVDRRRSETAKGEPLAVIRRPVFRTLAPLAAAAALVLAAAAAYYVLDTGAATAPETKTAESPPPGRVPPADGNSRGSSARTGENIGGLPGPSERERDGVEAPREREKSALEREEDEAELERRNKELEDEGSAENKPTDPDGTAADER